MRRTWGEGGRAGVGGGAAAGTGPGHELTLSVVRLVR